MARKSHHHLDGGLIEIGLAICLGLGYETGFEGLDANIHALDLAGRKQDFDALQVRAELTFRRLGYVCSDATALLGLAFTVNDAPCRRAFSCDCANSGHG